MKWESNWPSFQRILLSNIPALLGLSHGKINPKEVLKDQINLKSGLDEMKRRNKKWKSEDQMSVIKNVQNFFDLRKENNFF